MSSEKMLFGSHQGFRAYQTEHAAWLVTPEGEPICVTSFGNGAAEDFAKAGVMLAIKMQVYRMLPEEDREAARKGFRP